MQQHIVEPAAVLCRKRCAVGGAAADLGRPGVRAGGIAQYRQRKRLRTVAGGLLIEEKLDCIEPGSVHCADLRDGRSQFAGQLQSVDFTAAGLHKVAHVQQDQGRQSQSQHRRGQH